MVCFSRTPGNEHGSSTLRHRLASRPGVAATKRQWVAFVSNGGVASCSRSRRIRIRSSRTIISPLRSRPPRIFPRAKTSDFPLFLRPSRQIVPNPSTNKQLTPNFNKLVIRASVGAAVGELSGGPDRGGIYASVWAWEKFSQASKVRICSMVSGHGGRGPCIFLLSSCSGADL